MTLNLQSREMFLGNMIRRIKNASDITDFSAGGALITLLEAIAQRDFQQELNTLKILEQTDIDNLTGQRLDEAAISIDLPNGIGGTGRRPASQARDTVIIDSPFSKVSTRPYVGKPAPYISSNILYLQNATDFTQTPSTDTKIYIGRGTSRFEGPIQYTDIENMGSYWKLTLISPLTKDHTHQDEVVLAQGGDRQITAGTQVFAPANAESPQVSYTVDTTINLPDGESTTEVQITCTEYGDVGNVAINAITSFSTPPFTGALVSNPRPLVSGLDTESDSSLRQRIKDYPSTLSRGVATAIKRAIVGATDPLTGKAIATAVIEKSLDTTDPTIIYIDDGSVLEPVFSSQSYELLLANASGREKTFKTAQAPVTPVLALGQNEAPFAFRTCMAVSQAESSLACFTTNSSISGSVNFCFLVIVAHPVIIRTIFPGLS